MKILTIEELKKIGKSYEIFENGDYCYFYDTNKVLVRNGKIIVVADGGIKSYSDGWYLYCREKNNKKIYYLMNENGNEILVAEWINRDIEKRGIKKEFYIKDTYSYLSKEEVIKHYEERKKITSIKALTKKEIENLGYDYTEFENGDYKYKNLALGKNLDSFGNKNLALGKNLDSFGNKNLALGKNLDSFGIKDNEDVEYLIRDGKTIAVGREIESHLNGWYQYRYRRPGNNYDVDRLLNENHHIIAESKKISVREDDYEIFDEEDFKKFENRSLENM